MARDMDSDKRDVLLALLNEKYQSIHVMRRRVETYYLASVGFLVGLVSWVIQHEGRPQLHQSILLSVTIIVGIAAIVLQICDIRKGFQSTWAVVRGMEDLLGCWKPDHFGPGTGTLYPETWQATGTKKGKGRFFGHCFTILVIAALIALASIWIRYMCAASAGSTSGKADHRITQELVSEKEDGGKHGDVH